MRILKSMEETYLLPTLEKYEITGQPKTDLHNSFFYDIINIIKYYVNQNTTQSAYEGSISLENTAHIFQKVIAIFLIVLIYSFCFSGCCNPQDDSGAAPETVCSTMKEETITIGNIHCNTLSRELTVMNADYTELERVLPLLPQLETLTLEGTLPRQEELLALKEQFPTLSLIFPVNLGGKVVFTDAVFLDLTDVIIELEELAELLPLFSRLQELTVTGTTLTDEEKITLCMHLPEIFVRCELPLAGQYFPTDSTEIDISGCPVTSAEVEEILPCFPRLKKLDLSFCGIPDEEMETLNQRYPSVAIVWTVTIGEVKTRTDALYFYPAEFNYYPTNEEMKKLRYCTELIAIDIGHTRASDCEFLWYTPKVRFLILADTGITDITPVSNLRELIYLELFNLRIKDYAPLLNCTKLQDLNIGTTHADPGPLSKMTWLHNLQWHRADQNPATKEAVLKLPQQLPDTNVELYPKKKARNIGGPWRYLPNYYVFRDIIGADYFNQDQIGDYWGTEDGERIMACNRENTFAANTLAEIVRERIDNGKPIVGVKDIYSDKAEILYQTLTQAESWITAG